MPDPPVSTVDEAQAIIHLAARYFSNALVDITPDRARELILQAASRLQQAS